jgi:predicted ribonuclease YlaK
LKRSKNNDIVFGIGPAGTGKTFLAVAMAVQFLLAKRVNRIVLARPAVEAGEKLGFLPGDLQEKVDPYLRPLYDSLFDLIDEREGDPVSRKAGDRGRATRLHARSNALRLLRHSGRGAEHHLRADEDVSDADRIRIEGGDHR